MDALVIDLVPEPTKSNPPATESIAGHVARLGGALKFQGTQTKGAGAKKTFFNSAGTPITEKAVSDDGTTYTEQKMVVAP